MSKGLFKCLINKCGFHEVDIHRDRYVSWENEWRGCVKEDIFVLKYGDSYSGYKYACGELTTNINGHYDMKTVLITTDIDENEATCILKRGIMQKMLKDSNNYFELYCKVHNFITRQALKELD